MESNSIYQEEEENHICHVVSRRGLPSPPLKKKKDKCLWCNKEILSSHQKYFKNKFCDTRCKNKYYHNKYKKSWNNEIEKLNIICMNPKCNKISVGIVHGVYFCKECYKLQIKRNKLKEKYGKKDNPSSHIEMAKV